jgi:LmbE family N-acetylglucosaminyl deacetylase
MTGVDGPVVQRLLVVVAHPDDETFGTGSIIALAAAAGLEVTVCCATSGEAGEPPPGLTGDLGALREVELRAAGAALGVNRFVLLGYHDSGMGGEPGPETLVAADFDDVVARIGAVIDDTAPHVLITLDPDHGDGHRDHIVVGRATVQASKGRPGMRVYAWALARPLLARWFAELESVRPDSEHLDLDRVGLGRELHEITATVDVSTVLEVREHAMTLHASQTSPYEGMPPELRADFLRTDRFVRLLPEGHSAAVETALF